MKAVLDQRYFGVGIFFKTMLQVDEDDEQDHNNLNG